ncbi:hypothetical protein R8Z50_34460 [Longispora sp. K20-0274]|uniref:hypothetical protein n=1 Tax=Longispora sp. K20-0274 TaxID=3088255 RepID=UPI00399AC766
MVNEIGYGSFHHAGHTYLVEGNPMCAQLQVLRLADGAAVPVGRVLEPDQTVSVFRPEDRGLTPQDQRHLLLKALEIYHLHHGRDFTDVSGG